MALKGLIFDCDGTLADTEEAHRAAFNAAFADAGLGWHWSMDLYGKLLKVTGGRERIAHFMAAEGVSDVDIPALHRAKNLHYARRVEAGGIALRPGVIRLMHEARGAGLALAIATTTSRSNLESLIGATSLSDIDFAALVCGEDVTNKKPDPEAFQVALGALSLSSDECIAFEDSRNGVVAARGAGIATVATPSLYTKDEDFWEAQLLLPDLSFLFSVDVENPISTIDRLARLAGTD
jgi:HAD superfamily hydrolase (TIGR01509 family)